MQTKELHATIDRLRYEQQLIHSMHECSAGIDKRMFTQQRRWVCDKTLDLTLHHCNRQQGPTGNVLFLSSLFLDKQLDLLPDTVVDCRRVSDCSVFVKAINVDTNHWIAAVWTRQQPTILYTLDSLSYDPTRQHLDHFTAFCQSLIGQLPVTVEVIDVAQQQDGTSCGLFVIEFCKVLAGANADITSEQTRAALRAVRVDNTRQWLGVLSKNLGMLAPVPQYRRAKRRKAEKIGWLQKDDLTTVDDSE